MTDTTATMTAAPSTEIVPAASVEANPFQGRKDPLAFIITTDKSLSAEEAKVTALTTMSLAYGAQAAKSSDDLAKELYRFRRMFKAPAGVRALLGDDDAPDLMGRSDGYIAAITRVNKAAEDAAIDRLVEEGFTLRLAKAAVETEREQTRNRTSRAYRQLVERDAAKQGKTAGKLMLLAYGFSSHQACGKDQLIGAGERLGWALPTGSKDPKTIGNALVIPKDHKLMDGKIVPTTSREPVEQTDQATPTETADALNRENAEAEGLVLTNPKELCHLVVANLRTVAQDKRWLEVPQAERLVEAKVVLQAVFEYLTATGEGMEAKVRDSLVREVGNMAATAIGVLNPALVKK